MEAFDKRRAPFHASVAYRSCRQLARESAHAYGMRLLALHRLQPADCAGSPAQVVHFFLDGLRDEALRRDAGHRAFPSLAAAIDWASLYDGPEDAEPPCRVRAAGVDEAAPVLDSCLDGLIAAVNQVLARPAAAAPDHGALPAHRRRRRPVQRDADVSGRSCSGADTPSMSSKRRRQLPADAPPPPDLQKLVDTCEDISPDERGQVAALLPQPYPLPTRGATLLCPCDAPTSPAGPDNNRHVTQQSPARGAYAVLLVLSSAVDMDGAHPAEVRVTYCWVNPDGTCGTSVEAINPCWPRHRGDVLVSLFRYPCSQSIPQLPELTHKAEITTEATLPDNEENDQSDFDVNPNDEPQKDNETILAGYLPKVNNELYEKVTVSTNIQWDYLSELLSRQTIHTVCEMLQVNLTHKSFEKLDYSTLNREQLTFFGNSIEQ
ncbi:Neurexin-3b [Frankliniella fusca]|uniref:Neurexin-3b n=1 Tax=Frankliniella fusca TaxID=407009 RepID=A0AAE1H1J6_9NEOP|nr:Neurexin-3b [Frankliniella fusca]